jgi:hypothetical protein
MPSGERGTAGLRPAGRPAALLCSRDLLACDVPERWVTAGSRVARVSFTGDPAGLVVDSAGRPGRTAAHRDPGARSRPGTGVSPGRP